MHMMRVALVLLCLLTAACQGTPPPRDGSRASDQDPATRAAQALEQRDYAGAAELYRTALRSSPESLNLHYGLGVSTSHLDQRAEAVREMSWVVEHGAVDSEEVRTARRWLQSVGIIPGVVATARAEGDESRDKAAASATVHGRVMIAQNGNDAAPAVRQQLFLMEHATKDPYFRLRTDEQGNYRFENVPPGTYKLTDRAAGAPTWRLRVEIKAGQDLTLDLSPANSTGVRDDFPEATPAVGSSSS